MSVTLGDLRTRVRELVGDSRSARWVTNDEIDFWINHAHIMMTAGSRSWVKEKELAITSAAQEYSTASNWFCGLLGARLTISATYKIELKYAEPYSKGYDSCRKGVPEWYWARKLSGNLMVGFMPRPSTDYTVTLTGWCEPEWLDGTVAKTSYLPDQMAYDSAWLAAARLMASCRDWSNARRAKGRYLEALQRARRTAQIAPLVG